MLTVKLIRFILSWDRAWSAGCVLILTSFKIRLKYFDLKIQYCELKIQRCDLKVLYRSISTPSYSILNTWTWKYCDLKVPYCPILTPSYNAVVYNTWTSNTILRLEGAILFDIDSVSRLNLMILYWDCKMLCCIDLDVRRLNNCWNQHWMVRSLRRFKFWRLVIFSAL